MARLAGQGAMALLELDAEATEALIADYPEVTVAVYASPRQTVIAGPPEQIDAVIAVVRRPGPAGAPHRRRCGLASPRSSIRSCPSCGRRWPDWRPRARRIPIISTVRHVPGPTPAFDADYWVANLRNPVRFSQAVAAAGADHATFIEISPHPLLTHAITDTLARYPSPRLGTLARDTHDTLTFHTNLNATHTTHPPGTHHPPEPHPRYPPPPGTTPTTGSPAARRLRWRGTRCSASASRIQRTAPACGKAHSVRIFCGSVITASTTRACCPGRRMPNSRWRP